MAIGLPSRSSMRVTRTVLSDGPCSPVPSHQPSAVRTFLLTLTSAFPAPYPTRAARRSLTAFVTAVVVASRVAARYALYFVSSDPVRPLVPLRCGEEKL